MKKSRGFTLLEVMIAVAVLAVSLLAIFNLQSTALVGSARAQKIALAMQLSRAKMNSTLIALEAGIVKGEFPEEKEENGTFEEEKYPDYYWKVQVKKVEIPVPPLPKEGGDVMGQIFKMVAEQLSESTREVMLTVGWKDDADEEEVGIVLTTHIVKM